MWANCLNFIPINHQPVAFNPENNFTAPVFCLPRFFIKGPVNSKRNRV